MSAIARSDASGWAAELDLGFVREANANRTRLAEVRHRGPLRVQRPFHSPGDPACHVYVLHPPGGVVGGDRLTTTVSVAEEAHALVTTPAATKWYRADGRAAIAEQRLRVDDAAVLEWLPQENIVFDGALASQQTTLELAGVAAFIGWEIVCLGRATRGEAFARGRIDFRMRVQHDGKLVWLDRQRIIGADALLGARAGLGGHSAFGTLLATPAGSGIATMLRDALAATVDADVGITVVDGLLVARALAAEGRIVQRVLAHAWRTIRPRIVGAPASPPRIWNT